MLGLVLEGDLRRQQLRPRLTVRIALARKVELRHHVCLL